MPGLALMGGGGDEGRLGEIELRSSAGEESGEAPEDEEGGPGPP